MSGPLISDNSSMAVLIKNTHSNVISTAPTASSALAESSMIAKNIGSSESSQKAKTELSGSKIIFIYYSFFIINYDYYQEPKVIVSPC